MNYNFGFFPINPTFLSFPALLLAHLPVGSVTRFPHLERIIIILYNAIVRIKQSEITGHNSVYKMSAHPHLVSFLHPEVQLCHIAAS